MDKIFVVRAAGCEISAVMRSGEVALEALEAEVFQVLGDNVGESYTWGGPFFMGVSGALDEVVRLILFTFDEVDVVEATDEARESFAYHMDATLIH